ncbi:MAG: rRNA maturation RNase YbeY [Patescibacteria group bacterium]
MIEINNLTNFAVDKKFLTGVAKKVLKGENRKRENISIAFISSGEIKKLNQKYRKKNKPTDVLSFSKTLDFKSGVAEIVICPEVVKENAKKYGVPAKKEMMKVFTHGILHILGYEHEKSKKEAMRMEEKEKHYLSMAV